MSLLSSHGAVPEIRQSDFLLCKVRTLLLSRKIVKPSFYKIDTKMNDSLVMNLVMNYKSYSSSIAMENYGTYED